MTALAAVRPYLHQRHTGTRRKPPTGVPWPIQAVMITAALAMTAGFLAATHHQQLPRTEPACVHWHSCACRGRGVRWPGHNQLCAVNWGRPQATGKEQG